MQRKGKGKMFDDIITLICLAIYIYLLYKIVPILVVPGAREAEDGKFD